MKKTSKLLLLALGVTLAVGVSACSKQAQGADNSGSGDKDKITMVFYPNESAKDFDDSRAELQKKIEDATHKKVVMQKTTDYNVAIEAIASGKAQLAFMGADGYIQARSLNKKVNPLVVLSGPKGTLEGASYRSYLMVPKAKADAYKDGDQYSLKDVKGKKISFVSQSSTSGFAVPTDAIQREFKVKDKDTLSNSGKFFSKVIYGNTHPGSAVNLLKGDADVAAFDDIDLYPYLKLTSGSYDKAGSEFTVKDDAKAPFQDLHGKTAVAIEVSPVQNGPLVVNDKALAKSDRDKIQKALTSKEFAEDKKLFTTPGSKTTSLFQKTGADTHLLPISDSWYAPTHKLVGK
ncbi:PhnD/SsuA/transferrin family substrate-binding protein [Lactobacillus sp. CC-MHH1034]|uniref:phosphate/phosphite/phosphonate ABC transporter substrate-binding protein n=1 Tax=Agrilactobacillus fermenti TaxID=2586909 RepID=UPI001E3063B2|nr:phosphate/phosphite/phosphonate ABC transporter substrate-binding protein [Agrilactobacillus fermenti]MCD2257290.1 PhnD/SsuA/transferrin family substrate-binding protein [Agrilactobacillus fermenti]